MRSFALRFQNRFARAAGAIGVRRGAPELSHLYYWALLANPLGRSFWFFLFHVIVSSSTNADEYVFRTYQHSAEPTKISSAEYIFVPDVSLKKRIMSPRNHASQDIDGIITAQISHDITGEFPMLALGNHCAFREDLANLCMRIDWRRKDNWPVRDRTGANFMNIIYQMSWRASVIYESIFYIISGDVHYAEFGECGAGMGYLNIEERTLQVGERSFGNIGAPFSRFPHLV